MNIRGNINFRVDKDTEESKMVTVVLGEMRCPKCHRNGALELHLDASERVLLCLCIVHRGIKYYEERDLVKLCYFKTDDADIFSGISAFITANEIENSVVGA